MNKKRGTAGLFFQWMRNGIAFCYSWLLILIIVGSYVFKIDMVPVEILTKVLVMVTGMVLVFTIFFLEGILKKIGFMTRLSYAMLTAVVYEIVCFYWIGIFKSTGSFYRWVIFFGIIIMLYSICIFIYYKYSKVKGEIYTKNLTLYKQSRRLEYEQNRYTTTTDTTDK